MSSFDIAAQPYIDCYAILRRGNKLAFVKRQNTGWMDGYYGLPSGKVDKGEDYKQGAAREALEEAGVTIKLSDLTFAHVQHRRADMDWVGVFFEVATWEGEPYNAEPEKATELAWLDVTNLPENVIPSVKTALEAIERGEHYSTFGWE